MINDNLNIIDIYDAYLDIKQEEHKLKYSEHKGWFSASTAGSCFKKQWYKLNEEHEEPLDKRVKRLLRLGTIVHKDVQEAIDWYNDIFKTSSKNDSKEYRTEYAITLDEFKVIGHLDAMYIDYNNKTIDLIDLKTIGDYPWKMRFGIKKNRDKNPSNHYYYQVATYMLGIGVELDEDCGIKKEEREFFEYDMGIVWYNKNDSRLKSISIDPVWTTLAKEYWTELNEFIDSGDDIQSIQPGTAINVPAEHWECGYCPFETKCKGGQNEYF